MRWCLHIQAPRGCSINSSKNEWMNRWMNTDWMHRQLNEEWKPSSHCATIYKKKGSFHIFVWGIQGKGGSWHFRQDISGRMCLCLPVSQGPPLGWSRVETEVYWRVIRPTVHSTRSKADLLCWATVGSCANWSPIPVKLRTPTQTVGQKGWHTWAG